MTDWTRHKCEGCGTVPVLAHIQTTNGSLFLCRQCRDDVNGKSPLLKDAIAREDALFAEVKHLRAVDVAARKELDRLAAERDALRARIAELEASLISRAERQEEFASTIYTQHTDADRAMFRHAAKMLRLAAAELLSKRAGSAGEGA